MQIYLQYNPQYEGGEICAGQEDQSYPDREPAHITLTWEGAFVKRARSAYVELATLDLEEGEELPSNVWVVIVRYTDGDTFGYCTGYHEVIGVFSTEEKAEAYRDLFKKEGNSVLPPGTYPSWQGYFARLENVEIAKIKVEG